MKISGEKSFLIEISRQELNPVSAVQAAGPGWIRDNRICLSLTFLSVGWIFLSILILLLTFAFFKL